MIAEVIPQQNPLPILLWLNAVQVQKSQHLVLPNRQSYGSSGQVEKSRRMCRQEVKLMSRNHGCAILNQGMKGLQSLLYSVTQEEQDVKILIGLFKFYCAFKL